MTVKQKPFVVVSAIWVTAADTQYSGPSDKQCHLILATNYTQASIKAEKLLALPRKAWLTRSRDRRYEDEAQVLVDACFKAHGY